MRRDRRVIDAAATIVGDLGGRLQRDVPLGPMTTYRVGGRAALFATLASVAEIAAVAEAVQATGIEVLVVGRGSNLLIADTGFDGLAITMTACAGALDLHAGDSADGRLITAGSAVLLPVLARRTAAAGLSGLEWAVGVPGSVGGGIKMNAGGHGSDVAGTLVSAEIFDISTNRSGTIEAAHLGLRFRGSSIANHQLVVSGTFRLSYGDRQRSEAEIAEIVRWRREHQPGGQNAGSVFVNPVPGEVAAGELIDRLGLRGLRIGTAEVSTKHANFIQTDEGGNAADVRALMEHVRTKVSEVFGFELRSEIRLVGFDDVTPSAHAFEPGVSIP